MTEIQKLDIILKRLSEANGRTPVLEFSISKFKCDLKEARALAEKLLADGYTEGETNSQLITPRGREFIRYGGYAAHRENEEMEKLKRLEYDKLDREEKEASRDLNRRALKYSKISLVLSIIAIIVAILALFIKPG